MLDNLKTDASIEDDKDILGGGGVLDTDLYDMVIEVAFLGTSKGGATSLSLHCKDANGRTFRNNLWITSGTAKGCKNYYIDSKDNKRYLPGFNVANAVTLLSLGKEISELTTEEKTLNLYDFEQKKEVPQQKDVIVDLTGAEITLGIMREIVDKTQQNDQGAYVPTGETREQNEIDKVFRTSDGFTVAEIKAEAPKAEFKNKWLEKNQGNIRNKAKGVQPGNAPAAATAAQGAAPATSLFAK